MTRKRLGNNAKRNDAPKSYSETDAASAVGAASALGATSATGAVWSGAATSALGTSPDSDRELGAGAGLVVGVRRSRQRCNHRFAWVAGEGVSLPGPAVGPGGSGFGAGTSTLGAATSASIGGAGVRGGVTGDAGTAGEGVTRAAGSRSELGTRSVWVSSSDADVGKAVVGKF